MLINFRLRSFPAEYKTITSVRPPIAALWGGPGPTRKALHPRISAKRACSRPDRLSFYSSAPRCPRYRFENLRITCAAAEIPSKPFLDIREVRLRLFFEQMQCGKNHSRGADAALRATAL